MACRMVASDSASSCGPHPNDHPPPPTAHEPKPTLEISSPLIPSGRVASAIVCLLVAPCFSLIAALAPSARGGGDRYDRIWIRMDDARSAARAYSRRKGEAYDHPQQVGTVHRGGSVDVFRCGSRPDHRRAGPEPRPVHGTGRLGPAGDRRERPAARKGSG